MEFNSNKAIFLQIRDTILERILSGDLKPGDKPEAVFLLADGDEPVAVYENCNLHGLWKATL